MVVAEKPTGESVGGITHHPAKYPAGTITTGITGAISELRVSADLLTRGFAIFRAVSQSCECDLIAMKNKKLFRVEVTTCRQVAKNGSLGNTKKADGHKFDILATYISSEDRIVYQGADIASI